MKPILELENLNAGEQLKRGDQSLLRYRLVYEENGLDLVGERALVFLKQDGEIIFATVAVVETDNVVNFRVGDGVSVGLYALEIVVCERYFPSNEETKLYVSASSAKKASGAFNADQLVEDIVKRLDLSQIKEQINAFSERLSEIVLTIPYFKYRLAYVKEVEKIRDDLEYINETGIYQYLTNIGTEEDIAYYIDTLKDHNKNQEETYKKTVEFVRGVGSELVDDVEAFIDGIDKRDISDKQSELAISISRYVKQLIPKLSYLSNGFEYEIFELLKQVEEKENGEEFFEALDASANGSLSTGHIIEQAEKFLEDGTLPKKDDGQIRDYDFKIPRRS
ncbi:hypothetical protein [Dolosigranulum pigrum]|uniref:hypothetical protein n=1 Tax=Dolosigranulum pigrum TaxID=29394 RepID=UPI00191B4984|nr:hypothetical protein [Dolosigranulum pigrum]